MDIQGSNPSYSPNPLPAASHSRSLLRWLESQAEQTPDAVAVEHHDSRLTYRELHTRARAIAQWLKVEGVRPGEPVGLCIERGIPGLVTLLGILKAGAGIAPLDPQYPIARLRDMAEVARLRFVVCSEATKSLLRSMEGLRVIQLPDLQDSNREFAADPPVDSDPHSLLYVIFTSGSTGRPKGVAMPQSPLVNLVQWQARQSSLPGVGTRTLQFTTLSFDVAYQEIFLTWSTGGTLVLISEELRYDPAALWRHILAARVQRLFLPCIALNQLVDAALRSGQVDSDLREIITAGEQLRITAHMRQFFSQCSGLSLHNHYGPSETHVASAYQLSGHPASWEELPPIGRAIAATELHILSKDLTPVADGEDGELFISGECLADGYIHQPELTQARFIELQLSGKPAVRAYRTGDLARRRADGEIMFLGRLDDQIKIRGFRIELGEVETVLCSHPAVREALAVAVGDGADRRLAACLVLVPGITVETQSLRDHVRSKLSEHFVPSLIRFVEKLPLTPSGKADRRAAASGFEGRILEASLGETPPGTAGPTPPPSMSDRVEAIWRALLHLPAIPHDVRFFDAGGNSLLLVSLQERLERELAVRISVADLFRYSTISQQAAWLGTPSPTRVTEPQAHPAGMPLPDPSTLRDTSIAVVGMAGRFPGCSNVDELWENLCAGKELTTVFDDAQLSANGTSPEALQDPAFTRRRGVLENPGAFDAEFFSMTSQEARLTDPQHRLFLECAWAALEDAGCDPHRVQGLAGVYAGCSLNTYFLNQVAVSRARMASFTLAFQADQYPTLVGNDKDYLATRVAYKLHLRGPAVSIQTACSTSLTAVVQACAALQSGQCDVALAGGASVSFPQERGCLHQEGAIVSADGRCRPFDAKASGTVFGAGVGVVVLKRLSDALASGDQIHAVIRGAALNNDGGDKASFSAPSAKGQADVIRRAMELAGMTPDQVGYVEAHGTGTPLGDPIEVQALKEVFGDGNRRRQKCWLGSIKGNTGHLEAAAGITGLLKAVLAVREGRIPGTAHFESPNPKCALDDSCFAVNSTVKEWSEEGHPRCAGVSSFGVGGTNAHVIVQQPPDLVREGRVRTPQLLVLSARSSNDLEQVARELIAAMPRSVRSGVDVSKALAAIAYTLQMGRRTHKFRRSIVTADPADAIQKLESLAAAGNRADSACAVKSSREVAFLFPGQGAQYVGMGRELYETEPVFKQEFDRCADWLAPGIGLDLRELFLFSGSERSAEARQTAFAQPGLLCVELALARLWMDWGVRPQILLGHSIGEYAAAVVAGVMTREDALSVVAKRGRLMQDLPPGGMLSVRATPEQLVPLLPHDAEIAAINAPQSCVVSGPLDAIDLLTKRLAERDLAFKTLQTSHAFHSGMMDPILAEFSKVMRSIPLQPASISLVSTRTGGLVSREAWTQPDYWVEQIRMPVLFATGIQSLMQAGDHGLLECGPGQALSALARQQPRPAGTHAFPICSSLPPPGQPGEMAAMLAALGRLWEAGVEPDWERFTRDQLKQKVSLPGHPLHRKLHWMDADGEQAPVPRRDDASHPAKTADLDSSSLAVGISGCLEETIRRQLELMSLQLESLGGLPGDSRPESRP